MTASQGAESFQSRLSKAGRRFNAWWEGYAYDAGDPFPEQLAAALGGLPVGVEISESIWGANRIEPGDAAWTMRHARALGLPTRAQVLVFGAGLGAPLKDLKTGTRWKVAGFTHTPRRVPGLDLRSYASALTRLTRSTADGALCFFELHRDADPAGFARLAAEHLRPGAPLAFVDYVTARKSVRLQSCFPAEAPGAPRCAADYGKALKDAGFLVGDTIDETRSYTPLLARGWRDWRKTYERVKAAQDVRLRAEKLRFLAAYAQLWAERLDALRSGHLQVVRMQARKAV